MPPNHRYQQIGRLEVENGLSFEVETCVLCGKNRCLEVQKAKVQLDTSLEVAPYLKAAYHDLSYVLINYTATDLKVAGVKDPETMLVAIKAFTERYSGLDNEDGVG